MIWFLLVLSRLPLAVLYGLARVLYLLAYYVFRLRKKVVFHNLRASFPGKSESEIATIATSFYRNLADVVAEVVKGMTIDPAELKRRVEVRGTETVDEHCRAGRSVLLLAAHQANWEWTNLALSLALGYPLHVAYKPARKARSDALIRRIRCRFGSEVIPAKTLARDILRRKDLVRCIAIVADQVPTTSQTRIWLDFLNQPTAFFPGPEKLAESTGFPVMFIGIQRVRRGFYRVELSELVDSATNALDPEEVTRRYAAAVEQQILASPADWFWIHKRWKLVPPSEHL